MTLLQNINEVSKMTADQISDIDKLVSEYSGMKQGLDIKQQAGHDLEMLEYSPEEIPGMIALIMKSVKK